MTGYAGELDNGHCFENHWIKRVWSTIIDKIFFFFMLHLNQYNPFKIDNQNVDRASEC
jgi:hypothetical protein